jgi:hypothetical protein
MSLEGENPTPQDGPPELQQILGRLQRHAIFRSEIDNPLTEADKTEAYARGSRLTRSEIPPSREQKEALIRLIDDVASQVREKGEDFTHADNYERDLHGGKLTPEEERERFFIEFDQADTTTFISTDTYQLESDPDSVKLFHTTYSPRTEIGVSVDHNYLFRLDIDFIDPVTHDVAFVHSSGGKRKRLSEMSTEEHGIMSYYLARSKEALQKVEEET